MKIFLFFFLEGNDNFCRVGTKNRVGLTETQVLLGLRTLVAMVTYKCSCH